MIPRDEIGIDIKYGKSNLSTYKRVEPGQFVIHLRSFQGGFAAVHETGIVSPAYTVIGVKSAENHSPLFWEKIFTSKSFIKKLESVTYGIRDGRSISFSDFSTLKLSFTSANEQKTIGDFFATLDSTLTLQQRKLDALKDLKKSLLKAMFI